MGIPVFCRDSRVVPWSSLSGFNPDAKFINVLRRVLGDSSLNPLYIETIPGKGYVFISQPEVSNHPNDFHLTLPMDQASRATAKSRFFSIRCIIGLILIGMVFGVGMMAVWISHHG